MLFTKYANYIIVYKQGKKFEKKKKTVIREGKTHLMCSVCSIS
jgi:hypothetical protein